MNSFERVEQNEEASDSITREQIFKQYEIFVASAEKISSNRISVNKFFVTINSFIVTVYSLCFEKISSAIWVVPILGIIVSLAWIRMLKSYSMLNSAKFKIINEVEEGLPLQPYKDEWDILKNDCKYKTLSKTEQYVPYAFCILFIIILLIQVHSGCIK